MWSDAIATVIDLSFVVRYWEPKRNLSKYLDSNVDYCLVLFRPAKDSYRAYEVVVYRSQWISALWMILHLNLFVLIEVTVRCAKIVSTANDKPPTGELSHRMRESSLSEKLFLPLDLDRTCRHIHSIILISKCCRSMDKWQSYMVHIQWKNLLCIQHTINY